MFDESKFRKFLGKVLTTRKSEDSYISGLRYIEKVYGVSIYDECQKDTCKSLLEKLKEEKETLNDNKTRKRMGDCISHLKKYVEFMNSDKNMIDFIIASYIKEFSRLIEEEQYKWKAVKHFIENWDIDSDDFATMFKEAFSKHGNLLNSANYNPYKMLCLFAENYPEEIRVAFKNLYDDSLELGSRVLEFQKTIKLLFKRLQEDLPKNEKMKSTYQDAHAISTYLFFRYPEKYYIYKYGIYDSFRHIISFAEEKLYNKVDINRLLNYFNMCDKFRTYIIKNEELLLKSKERIAHDCYSDEGYHLLVHDLLLFASRFQKEEDNDENNFSVKKEKFEAMTNFNKNIILYGPPGTGKTLYTALYAIAIIEGKSLGELEDELRLEDGFENIFDRYKKYKKEELIEFVSFHQSYSYEEFIEGIRPKLQEDDSEQSGEENSLDLTYEIRDGLFKAFCDKAKNDYKLSDTGESSLDINNNVWKVSLYGTGDNPIRRECLENGHIRIGWDDYGKDITDDMDYYQGGARVLNAFINKMDIGDLVVSCYSATTTDAIGVLRSEYEWDDDYEEFNRLRKVEWLVRGIEENIVEINAGKRMSNQSIYKLNASASDIMEIVDKHIDRENNLNKKIEKNNKKHVFIIDEINRGNISQIFGELITLIEPSKRIGRAEELRARLPYSNESFGVPDNVYIIATMNTADRSIAMLDTALRRRFYFKEMRANPTLLGGVYIEGLSLETMLRNLNRKIAILFDREHEIGHSFFIPLIKEPEIELLASIFENSVIPLLQEYFYEDYEKIALVLGDNKKEDSSKMIIRLEDESKDVLFGPTELDLDEGEVYEINLEALNNIETYKYI